VHAKSTDELCIQGSLSPKFGLSLDESFSDKRVKTKFNVWYK